jgi:hypothetical protein
MRYWIRELAGWVLVGLGLYAFYLTWFDLLRQDRIVESGTMTVIGVFLFRGGLHLIKVAVAARVCLDAQAKYDSPAHQLGKISVTRIPVLPASERKGA